jgi:predicted HicB family RNase H-like nuclease
MPAPKGNKYAQRPVATHRSKQVNVRMTLAQFEQLQKDAMNKGQSLNAYVRQRLGLEEGLPDVAERPKESR